MTLGHGPKIITDGLVFAYDMGPNPGVNKSWKGKPAVNTWYNDSYTYTNAATFSIVTDYPSTQSLPIEARGKKVIKLIADTPGTLGQCIPWRSGVDQVNGGTYNHSVWCYLESGSTVTVGQHWNPWDYGSSQYPPLGKWVRLNDPVTNSANNYGNIANAYQTDGVAYFTAPQYELGTDMSPFVHGTRSNTQALLDWTGNNTITVNSSVVYNSDGTFSFDGTNFNSYASIPSQNLNNCDYTVEAWFNPSAVNRTQGIIGDYQYNWWRFNITSGNKVNVGHKQSDSLGGPNITGSTTITANTWWHAVMTFNTVSGMKLYVNGVLDASTTNNLAFTITDRGPQYIGHYRGGAPSSANIFQGQISSIKIYKNKELSATEVAQNFQALRGRYGI